MANPLLAIVTSSKTEPEDKKSGAKSEIAKEILKAIKDDDAPALESSLTTFYLLCQLD
jgi:DeoR/GlpR family transcriptional regulator of sugar metabolism